MDGCYSTIEREEKKLTPVLGTFRFDIGENLLFLELYSCQQHYFLWEHGVFHTWQPAMQSVLLLIFTLKGGIIRYYIINENCTN